MPWVNVGMRIGPVYTRIIVSGFDIATGVEGVGLDYLLIVLAFPITAIIFTLKRNLKGVLISSGASLVGTVVFRLAFENLMVRALRENIATFRYLMYLDFTGLFTGYACY